MEGFLMVSHWEPFHRLQQGASQHVATGNNQVVNERKKISNCQLYTTDILA